MRRLRTTRPHPLSLRRYKSAVRPAVVQRYTQSAPASASLWRVFNFATWQDSSTFSSSAGVFTGAATGHHHPSRTHVHCIGRHSTLFGPIYSPRIRARLGHHHYFGDPVSTLPTSVCETRPVMESFNIAYIHVQVWSLGYHYFFVESINIAYIYVQDSSTSPSFCPCALSHVHGHLFVLVFPTAAVAPAPSRATSHSFAASVNFAIGITWPPLQSSRQRLYLIPVALVACRHRQHSALSS